MIYRSVLKFFHLQVAKAFGNPERRLDWVDRTKLLLALVLLRTNLVRVRQKASFASGIKYGLLVVSSYNNL